MIVRGGGVDFAKNAQIFDLDYKFLPRNKNFDLDLHRPYIDDFSLDCHCGGKMKRVPEVFDCWFESGSMPFASNHYPFGDIKDFDPKSHFFRKSVSYPARFIAEGLDQTRGWFYSMLVLGTALFGKTPYESVVVNGIILAENGEKMSKRLKNYPDPLYVLDKDGNVATEVTDRDGKSIVTRDGDIVPILDDFIKLHPDFSWQGVGAGLLQHVMI
jgi:isoleucyl-tRNA synthetase